MSHFRLLTRTRQVTEYSCGASAMQSVLAHWGKDVDEDELMQRLRTTSEVGTYPQDIVRVAQELGCEAEVRENLTLDEVEQFTAQGHPMIALAQVWLSEEQMADSVAQEWDTGHYIVVLGVDNEYVYFQDPYARMGKGFIPRTAFEEHWHQVMGGDHDKNPELNHLGVFIRSGERAEPRTAGNLRLSDLDFQRFG